MELFTVKGIYAPGEPVELLLRLSPGEDAGEAELTITRLGDVLGVYRLALNGRETLFTLPGETHMPPKAACAADPSGLGAAVPVAGNPALPRSPLSLYKPSYDAGTHMPPEGAGLGVEAVISTADGEIRCATAVPFGGNIVRYGFLSDFLPEDAQDVACLAAWHMTHVQFYDWSYRHDTLVSPTDEYEDMMGKRNSLPAVRAKVDACHAHGMRAMAYGAVYAASRSFRDAHADWGLYAAPDKPLSFIDTFFFMDVEGPWREHLFSQYRSAMERIGFDGVHMDTYGYPKRALGMDGRERDLERSLPALIEDADIALRAAGLTPHLIFNNVGTWPVEATKSAPQDAVYMELWPPYDRLRHLRQAVRLADGCAKPVVLAAYLEPFRTDTAERALYCALITSFAIALCGATQLFLGESDAVLTQGYYADYTRLEPRQLPALHAYQDFFVRYQELFFDPELRDVSMTHTGWDNLEYRCETPFSVEGEADMLWLTCRERAGRKLVGLLNLTGNDDRWNRGKNAPTPLENIVMHIQLTRPVARAWYASPDEALGRAAELPLVLTETDRGPEAAVTIPRLFVSGLLWLDV